LQEEKSPLNYDTLLTELVDGVPTVRNPSTSSSA